MLCRQSNVPVSGLMLQEEALISKRLGGKSMGFTASNGWLSTWIKGTTSVK